jgi:cell division protein FtsW (lipid II flippase)
VKESLAGIGVGAGSGLSLLAGAPWWAVLIVVAVVIVSSYVVVCWLLSKNPRIKRITTPFLTVDTGEPEELPPKKDPPSKKKQRPAA